MKSIYSTSATTWRGTERSHSIVQVYVPACAVIIPLIAASAFTPPWLPQLLRQAALCLWGVGATLLFERFLFSDTFREAVRAIGFTPARRSALLVATLLSLPMWISLPALAWLDGASLVLRPDWLSLLVGVVLVNGITEEVIHRGFVFGHLRRGRSFVGAATLSAVIFAAQHLYLIDSIGWISGLASVLLAALLAYPMAYLFERGGLSIGASAILHTSSNAPVILTASSGTFLTTALVPHMGVILVSLYGVFVFRRFLSGAARQSARTDIPATT